MEEKERYKLESHNGTFCDFHDTETDEWYTRKDLVTDLLNQQDKRIKELEDKDWYEQCIKQLEEQNTRLLQENQQLKQKAIIPKFSLGQEVWAISVYRKDCIDNFIIQEICFCSRYGLYYKTNMGINLYEYYFDIFATKEEAEAKLKEIKRGK